METPRQSSLPSGRALVAGQCGSIRRYDVASRVGETLNEAPDARFKSSPANMKWEEGKPKEGQTVRAAVGTKVGTGIVKRVMDDCVVVEFPDAVYPDTMIVPTGIYCIGKRQFLGVV